MDLSEVTIRLAMAGLCGAVIGLERETHAQAAGLRTHMVLAVGSALIMIVSLHVGQGGNDPGRIAAQIVSGIGFLGAGAILRYGTTIRGLTTAACIWTAAGIGMAVGAGLIAHGAVATAMVFLVVWGIVHVEKWLGIGRDLRRMKVEVRDVERVMEKMREVMARHKAGIRRVSMVKERDGGKVVYDLDVMCADDQDLEPMVREMGALSEVDRIELE